MTTCSLAFFFDKLMHCLLILFACASLGAAYAPLPTVMALCVVTVLRPGGYYEEANALALLCIPLAGALILFCTRSTSAEAAGPQQEQV